MCIIWNTDVGRVLKYCKRYFRCKHEGHAIAHLIFGTTQGILFILVSLFQGYSFKVVQFKCIYVYIICTLYKYVIIHFCSKSQEKVLKRIFPHFKCRSVLLLDFSQVIFCVSNIAQYTRWNGTVWYGMVEHGMCSSVDVCVYECGCVVDGIVIKCPGLWWDILRSPVFMGCPVFGVSPVFVGCPVCGDVLYSWGVLYLGDSPEFMGCPVFGGVLYSGCLVFRDVLYSWDVLYSGVSCIHGMSCI